MSSYFILILAMVQRQYILIKKDVDNDINTHEYNRNLVANICTQNPDSASGNRLNVQYFVYSPLGLSLDFNKCRH